MEKILQGQKVEYYKLSHADPEKVKLNNGRPYKELQGEAIFLAFGSDNSEEGGTFSTAIIKLPDSGKVLNIYVELIRFTEID